ncbi:hypothetical protein HYPSUDRAFT_140349, partial [Hypholoma sublateritium FD-334 SS-4]
EFEHLYYQRRADRIHFVRQSIHALLHLAPEVFRIGPPICSSQWTMERTIGNLGQEIRQPSNPYANLSRRGVLRCQVNALIAMFPGQFTGTNDSAPEKQLPRGAIDLGNGYALLRAQDQLRPMRNCEAEALIAYLTNQIHIDISVITSGCSNESQWCPNIARWARLQLPNGQIARSRWKEIMKPIDKVRISRHVKNTFTLAVISVYSEPNPTLLKESAGTVLACQYCGDSSLVVVDFGSIILVVAMVPHHFRGHDIEEDWRFVVEKPGLDVTRLGEASECEDSE